MIRAAFLALAFALAALPGLAREGGGGFPLAMNLAPVRDWSTEQPFIDVMKTARRWIGHKPGQWGGVSADELEARGIFDAQGWPTEIPPDLGSIGTLVLTDLPEDATIYAGRYVLRFQGTGIVEVSGAVRNVRYGQNLVAFDYVPGGMVNVKIQRTDPGRTGDHVRAITIVRQKHEDAFRDGALFNPDWLDALRGVRAIRFMDWMKTNDSTQGDWAARPRVEDFSYTRRGVPAEVMIALANELAAAPWFCMPHLSDDTYQRAFARLVKAGLDPGLGVYVEFSNEVWNWQFDQAEWAEAEARARWGRKWKGQDYYGMKFAQMTRNWAQVFGPDRARLKTVIATQTGWMGLEKAILEAPLWAAEDPAANAPPYTYADAYGVTGYFGGFLGREDNRDTLHRWLEESRAEARDAARTQGLEGAALDAYLRDHRFDAATAQAIAAIEGPAPGDSKADTLDYLLGTMLPYQADIARRYGLDLVAYEGGSHVVGLGALLGDDDVTAFFTHLNYTPLMAALYDRLLTGWGEIGGGLFALFNDVGVPSKWGSWGHMRYLGDDNPRWRAVGRFR